MAVTGNAGSATLGRAGGSARPRAGADLRRHRLSRGACSPGSDVTVTISYDKPFITGMFGATVDLTGTATRRCGG